MKTITLEDHFVTHEFLQATGAYGESAHPALAAVQPKLLDLGAGRIAAIDEGGVDVQVMSLASMGIDKLEPGTATALITGVNDELAAAIPSAAEGSAVVLSPQQPLERTAALSSRAQPRDLQLSRPRNNR